MTHSVLAASTDSPRPIDQSAGSALFVLLKKDARLVLPVLVPALFILGALCIVMAVAPLAKIVIGSLFWIDRSSMWTRIAALAPLFLIVLSVLPAWSACAIVMGDVTRGGALLSTMMPVADRTKWLSKFLVLSAVVALLAALCFIIISINASDPLRGQCITLFGVDRWGGRVFESDSRALLILIGLSVGAALWSAAIAAFAPPRSAYLLALTVPLLVALAVFGLSELFASSARAIAFAITGFEPKFALPSESELGFIRLTPQNFELAAGEFRPAISAMWVIALGALCLWHARGVIAQHRARVSSAWRRGVSLTALIVAGGVVTAAVPAAVVMRDWTPYIPAMRAQQFGYEQGCAMTTKELVAASLTNTRLVEDEQECQRLLDFDLFGRRWQNGPQGYFFGAWLTLRTHFTPERPEESVGLNLALQERMSSDPSRAELVRAFHAVINDSSQFSLHQRLEAAREVSTLASFELAARILVESASPCARLLAIDYLAQVDGMRPRNSFVASVDGIGDGLGEGLPRFRFGGEARSLQCTHRASAIVSLEILRRHVAGIAQQHAIYAAKRDDGTLGWNGPTIDLATIAKAREVLEQPIFELRASYLAEQARQRELHASAGAAAFTADGQPDFDCLECRGSDLFDPAATDPAYLLPQN